MGKSKGQKAQDPFRMVVLRKEDKTFHRMLTEWWMGATWGNAPVEEMGEYAGILDKLPRSEKQNGRLYFMRSEGRMHQANLYTLGNDGSPGEINIDMLEDRVRSCPLLAVGSIETPRKLAGNHASPHNIFCRPVLNFSLVIGFSVHGDKAQKNDQTSTIGHGWVDFAEGCNTVADVRVATKLLCNLCDRRR